jgi:hypothetical protein
MSIFSAKLWALVFLFILLTTSAAPAQDGGFAKIILDAIDPGTQSGQAVRGLIRNIRQAPVNPQPYPDFNTGVSQDNFDEPLPSFAPPTGNPTNFLSIPNLSGREQALLGTRDIVILVDKSGSMKEPDCPTSTISGLGSLLFNRSAPQGMSRWDWSERQISFLGHQTSSVLPDGFTLVLFSGGQETFRNVHADQIPSIFRASNPGGGTNMAKALKKQLNEYFAERNNNPYVKPLSIAIITDGVPDNARALTSTIIEATRQMQNPGEISISFLQVGNDPQGSRLLQDLDFDLVNQGAYFDIVSAKGFPELMRKGLPRAIAESVASPRRGTTMR